MSSGPPNKPADGEAQAGNAELPEVGDGQYDVDDERDDGGLPPDAE